MDSGVAEASKESIEDWRVQERKRGVVYSKFGIVYPRFFGSSHSVILRTYFCCRRCSSFFLLFRNFVTALYALLSLNFVLILLYCSCCSCRPRRPRRLFLPLSLSYNLAILLLLCMVYSTLLSLPLFIMLPPDRKCP